MRWMAVVVMGVLMGCECGGRRCEVDRNCLGGEVCLAGECRPVSELTGGGTATGGGGTTGGGTTTGGGGGTSTTCSQAVIDGCADWQECAPDEGGGSCVDAQLDVRWVTPADMTAFNTATAPGAVQVTKRDGGAVTLGAVPVEGQMDFVGAAGSYSGNLTLPTTDGVYEFVAGWPDGGPVGRVNVVKDTTAPEVFVSSEDRPIAADDPDVGFEGYWKKDEAAVIRVVVDGGLPAGAMNVAGSATPTACLTPCAGNCTCFAVDLSASTLNAFRGQVVVPVSGLRDAAGNVAGPQNAVVNVTRHKWLRNQTANSLPMRAVAVTKTGLVLWGVEQESAINYRLIATAQDGGTVWTTEGMGRMTAGPMVASTKAWFATSGMLGVALQPVSLSAGTQSGGECTASVGATEFRSDLALSALADGGEIPLAVRAGEVQAPVGMCRSHQLSPTPTSAGTARSSLVVLSRDGGATEAFVTYPTSARLWKAELGGMSGTTWTDMGDAVLPNGTQPRGLFLDGLNFVGGGGVAGNGAQFVAASPGMLSAGTAVNSVDAGNAGPMAVGPGYGVYGDIDGNLVRVNYALGVLAPSLQVSGGAANNWQQTTPLIGRDGVVYFVSETGGVTARDATTLAEEWNFPGVGGTTVVGEPALDVYRGANGAPQCLKPLGVLYVARRTNDTATLQAILVDSNGLDVMAPWPKYQHDYGNTGNSTNPTLSLRAGFCP